MRKYTSGWDYFTPEKAETFEFQNCRVCGAKFDVEKGIDSPTTRGEAMIKQSHVHDVLTCPYSGLDWHDQAITLFKEAEKTASTSLEAMLLDEANLIVSRKKATKPGFEKNPFL